MAKESIKFSQFPEADKVQDDDIIPIVQNGENKKVPFGTMKKYAGGSGSGSDTAYGIASPEKLGMVKPVSKTEEMTQDVGVDVNGRLYTKPGESAGNGAYRWAKYEAVGQSSGEITETEYEKKTFNTLSPSARILFKSAAYDSTQGKIVLSDPYSSEKLSGADQKNYYSEYPYFYGDYENGQTDNTVYKYVSLSQGSGGVVNGWSWTINKLELTDVTYTKGEYVGIVYAYTETAYPDDGVQGGYWYVLQRTQASNVSFDNAGTGLASANVQDAIKEIISYINEDLLGGAS